MEEKKELNLSTSRLATADLLAPSRLAKSTTLFFSISFLLFFSQNVLADIQSIGPVSLNLPSGWRCQNQDQNYICLDESPYSTKNAAIVISFKNRSPEDAIPVYRDQLTRPRNLYQGDLAIPSQPKGVTEKQINNVLWVEGIHLGSEVPDYYTHYYATVAGQHALLISVSIEKSAYQDLLSTVVQPIVNSIKVNVPQTANNINSTGAGGSGSARAGGVAWSSASAAAGKNQQIAAGYQSQKNLVGKNRITIFGYTLPKKYVYLGVVFIFVVGLLGYALMTD